MRSYWQISPTCQFKGNIIDLCSGNGVIPLLISNRTKASIKGIEIQERLYDMAIRKIEFNQLGEQIQMIHGDIKQMPEKFGQAKFDVVTCNPPIFQRRQKVKKQ